MKSRVAPKVVCRSRGEEGGEPPSASPSETTVTELGWSPANILCLILSMPHGVLNVLLPAGRSIDYLDNSRDLHSSIPDDEILAEGQSQLICSSR